MQILVLTHEYPPLGGGGGRVAQDVCRGLAQRGHEVVVLTAACGNLPYDQVQSGVRIRRLVSGRTQPFRAGLPAMGGFVFAALIHGLALSRTWKPDLIHAHFAVPAGAAAWALGGLLHRPYVLTAHLGDVPGGVPEKTGGWFRWLFPFTPPIWKGAAAVAAVSDFTRTLALRSYPVAVQVIPNGVDRVALDPGTIRVGAPPRLVFAGRFQPQKNPLELVRILADARDLPWQAEMIGDGPLRPQLQAEIARCGLAERITLPGWVTPETVIQRLRQADILFMPSLSEGLPVVGVQALALGLALLLSRVGGNVDLVAEGENGFLLAPDDHAGFVTALRALLTDPARLLAFRRASRAHSARFDLKAVVTAYERLFLEAAGRAAA